MDRYIAAETLAFFKNFNKRDARLDRQRGEEDGHREMPRTDSTHFSPHESARIAEARTALNEYMLRMRAEVDKIDLRIREFVSLRDQDYSSRKEALYGEKQIQLQQVNALHGTNSHRFSELIRQRDEAKRAYREKEHEAGRAPNLRMHEPIFDRRYLSWLSAYVLVLLFLAVLEVPVNQLAVQLAFEFSAWLSHVIAFLIGVTFILQAHFLGIQLLRAVAAEGWRKLGHVLACAVTLVLMVVMILVLFQMRGEVSDTIAAQSSIINLPDLDTSDVGQPVDQAGNFFSQLVNNLLATLRGDPGAGSFAQVGLLLLNGLVLLIGTVLSCIRHDTNPDLEQAYMRRRETERAVDYYLRDFGQKTADVEAILSRRIASAERIADQVDQDILNLEEERLQLKRQIENDIRTVLNVLAEQIAAYQESNARIRRSPDPAYFGAYGLKLLSEEVLNE